MSRFMRICGITWCSIHLSACMIDDTQSNFYEPAETQPSTMLYPEGYETPVAYATPYNTPEKTSKVVVPETYHVGRLNAPRLPHDLDHSWVSQQNPQYYTIELTEGAQAAAVAQTLAQAPKKARSAEVKYIQNNQPYYKGVYGSYATQEEASQALQGLSADLKQHASIQSWSTIQAGVD